MSMEIDSFLSYLKNIKVAGRDIENYKEETLRYELLQLIKKI